MTRKIDKKKLAEDTVTRVNKSFGQSEKLCINLRDEYQKALDTIQKEVDAFYTRYADKNGLTYKVAMEQLSRVDLRKYRRDFEEYSKFLDITDVELMAELDIYAAKEKVTRLEGLMTSIRLEVKKLEDLQKTKLKKQLNAVFEDNYIGAASGLTGIVEARASFAMINPSLIEETINFPWSGDNFSNIIWNDTNKLARELKKELTQGFIKGTSAHKMSANIAKRMETSYANAQRVVMTESAHVLNKASLMSYADNGVRQVEFLAVLDSRTSSICFNLNGDIMDIEDAVPGKNMPPLHPHCRSTIVPVIEDEEDNEE